MGLGELADLTVGQIGILLQHRCYQFPLLRRREVQLAPVQVGGTDEGRRIAAGVGLAVGLDASLDASLVAMPAVKHLALVQHDGQVLAVGGDVRHQVGELVIGEWPEL